MKISLVGYMGSGKSAVGQQLAQNLNLNFIDLDKEIEKECGCTIHETFSNKGELFFRQKEREVLERILATERFVLSTGGGTPCYYDNIDLMNRNSLTVYLSLPLPDLFNRLKEEKEHRPLISHLDGDGLKEFIGKHLMERNPFYHKATFVQACHGKSITEIVKEIKSLL